MTRQQKGLFQFRWWSNTVEGLRFVSKLDQIEEYSFDEDDKTITIRRRPKPQLESFGLFAHRKVYYPLRVSGLFRLLGELDPENIEQITDFANRWGPLSEGLVADKLTDWQKQIRLMKAGVWLFDKVKAGEAKAIARSMEEVDWVEESGPYGDEMLVIEGKNVKVLGVDLGLMVHEGASVLDKAWSIVERLINDQMFIPRFRLVVNAEDPAPASMMFTIVPKNLGDALWLQFAQALAGDKQWRKCAICDVPIEISLGPEGFRRNRVYCSDACRMKAYRRRKREG